MLRGAAIQRHKAQLPSVLLDREEAGIALFFFFIIDPSGPWYPWGSNYATGPRMVAPHDHHRLYEHQS